MELCLTTDNPTGRSRLRETGFVMYVDQTNETVRITETIDVRSC